MMHPRANDAGGEPILTPTTAGGQPAVIPPPLSGTERGPGGEAPSPRLTAIDFLYYLFEAHRDIGLRIEDLTAYHAPTRCQIRILAVRHVGQPETADPYLYHVILQEIDPFRLVAHGHTLTGETIHWIPMSGACPAPAARAGEAEERGHHTISPTSGEDGDGVPFFAPATLTPALGGPEEGAVSFVPLGGAAYREAVSGPPSAVTPATPGAHP